MHEPHRSDAKPPAERIVRERRRAWPLRSVEPIRLDDSNCHYSTSHIRCGQHKLYGRADVRFSGLSRGAPHPLLRPVGERARTPRWVGRPRWHEATRGVVRVKSGDATSCALVVSCGQSCAVSLCAVGIGARAGARVAMAPRKTDKRAQARRCHSMAVRVQVVIVSRERTAVEGARQLDHRYMQAFARLALPRARAIAVHIEHHERTTAPNASLAHDGLHIAVSARTRRVEGKLVGVCAVVLECAMYEGGVPCTIHTVFCYQNA
mmetsp:Transcript_6502/g.15220  ORF Transcript_6502/g.15220 Transcript_6502/m.15220 type:complete len:264 (+) Transcript_6502:325-1116(+)